jgi:hypothetical protein
MAEFKVINTQEELDAIIKDRVERAERKIRETRESYKDWISPADAQKAAEEHQAQIDALNEAHSKELEKYAGYDEKFKEFEAKIHGYELNALKARIAREKSLPYDAIEFLKGEDEATITESAEKLSKFSQASKATQAHGFTRDTEAEEADGVLSAFKRLNPNIKL